MAQKRFGKMSDAEFDELVNGFIDRTATSYGEMPAEFFLDLLVGKRSVG
jgi:hypothetical protein